MKHTYTFLLILLANTVFAQLTPEITSWKINTTGATGYAGILTNVQQVQYSTNNVYVSATCIPDYTIGPWTANPNIPENKNFVFKITRNPVQNTGTLTNTPLGHVGVWSNGVSIFNPKDGMSYNNAGVWNRDALYYEGISFDNCLGHPNAQSEYHLHVNPTCLYNDADSTQHSPIIGYAFDGFPVYGAYGYANTNGTGAIKRMTSSYEMNTGTTRINGPAVDATYPLGAFIEDRTFVSGAGDLDIHNGRFCVTPDYPDGIYAYFVTIDANLYPVYPYVLGPTYFGIVQAGNTGPNSGHNIITETVVTYTPGAAGISTIDQKIAFEYYPNPTNDYLTIFVAPGENNNLAAQLLNASGQIVHSEKNIQPAVPYIINVENLSSGIYYLKLQGNTKSAVQKISIEH
ncbi:MAG: YHYH protein [Chitinophagaceae bacterium]|nr:YHYH protein [Chitinophagaceae bacterium]